MKRLWVLMVTAFVDMLGYALVLPLLPLYAKDFGANAFTIGLLLAGFAFAQLLTAPLWGRLSDRIGRRPVIVGGQVMSAVAFLLFTLASVLPRGGGGQWTWPVLLLLFSRLAQGAGGGTISANHAYVADAVHPERRAQALGWITASTSAGVMIGPALGSLSLAWSGNDAAPGLISASLCALNVLFAWRWLPESTTQESRDTPRQRKPLLDNVAAVVRHPTRPVHTLIWVYASGLLAFMSASSVMALYLSDRFGIGKDQIGYFYVVIGFVSVVMRAVVLGWAVRLLGEVRVLRTGALAIAAGLVIAPLAAGPVAFLLAVLAIPLGTALLFPSTTSLISRYAGSSEVGELYGVQQAFGSTSRLLAPIWAGAAYQVWPPSAAPGHGGALPYWISAGILMLTLSVAHRIRPGEALKPRVPAASPQEDQAGETAGGVAEA